MANMTAPSPTSPGQRIAIGLSKEELFIVMRLLKARGIPGFDLSWLKTESDGSIPDEVTHSLEAAANALIARGYMEPEAVKATKTVKLNMPSPVIAMVGTCAFGIDSILLS